MKTSYFIGLLALFVIFHSCKEKAEALTDNNVSPLEKAEKQLALQLIKAKKADRIPRTITTDGQMHWTNQKFDWTEGFFPGSLWYMYKLTNDTTWKEAAESFQSKIEKHKYYTTNHDLGFIFNCSYGNGFEFTENEDFKAVMITAADSLSTRFNATIGCIKSWDVDHGWQAKRGWKFPVIIDNMMNLELLFKASQLSGDSKYKDIAISHANTTLKNHFRADNSSFHVVDYEPDTGFVRSKETAQGYSNESAWARGQAWGLYGYTVCYRYTKDDKYLEQARKIAKYINENKPADGIPYWDYNAKKIPNDYRDVSAASITVSALIELDSYTNESLLPQIDQILTSLKSDVYTSKIGENHNFILDHSVGSIPHGNEIDVPLNYADYYYIEALLRYQETYKQN